MSFTRDHWHKLEKKKKKKERGYEHEVDETIKRKRMLPPHPDECKKKKKKAEEGFASQLTPRTFLKAPIK